MPSRLAMQRAELLLNLLTPEGDTFLLSSLTLAHSVPLCRQTAKEEKNSRNQNRSGALPSTPCCLAVCSPPSSAIASHSCISAVFLPLPLTGNFCCFWLFTVFLLEWSPNSDCLCPAKTSLVSFPLGQQYPAKASKSKIRKRGKHNSVLCLENLRNGPWRG